jgi:hypothetical protein
VTSSSSILTFGNDSTGILAQSIGGGGGVGGINVSGDLTGATSVDLTLGASGAGGGNGNDVTIVATGNNILTFGDRSSGILAQSIGGGGGVGWVGVGGAVQANSATPPSGGEWPAATAARPASRTAQYRSFRHRRYYILAQSIGAAMVSAAMLR